MKHATLNCNGRLLDLDAPKVMAIVNVTPDSFFDGGKYNATAGLEKQLVHLVAEGADILDIGGYSSRPGADEVTVQEELDRVLPAIELAKKLFPEIPVSIDTFRAHVATEAVQQGAGLINDISGGDLDAEMFATVAQLSVPYACMHMQGTPATMQQNPYYQDVVSEVLHQLSSKLIRLKKLGVKDVLLDPGFGFGKTVEHNYQLLNNLKQLHVLEQPLLVGVSRKSMLYKVTNSSPNEALHATSAAHTVALQQGAQVLRVHDVRPAKDCIAIVQKLQENV